MLIRINKSKLFDTNPAIRFADEYHVGHDLWSELWKRYKLLGYTVSELTEYFQLKTGRQIRRRQVKRWIFLTEVYAISKPARDKGAEVVNTEMFGELEGKLIEEITRGLKFSGTTDSRIMA